jgi:energy-coupling factor transport system substrate-specific component
MSKTPFSFSAKAAPLALVASGVAINFIGKFAAQSLNFPLWLDAIGTIFSSMLGGPLLGVLTGLTTNVIYGATIDPVSFAYSLTSIAIGLTVGYLARFGFMRSHATVVLTGIVTVMIATVVSTPINMFFYDGYTQNVWGDLLYKYLWAFTGMKWLSSFCNELFVDLPDKILSVLIAYVIYRRLPVGLINRFNSSRGEVERMY